MFQDRKEYRKNFNAAGLLNWGGETLRFNCYDVSVKGVMVEIVPGNFLTQIEDFEALQTEAPRAEVFVEELNLAGEADVVWVKQERGRIMMGLEFQEVVHHASKLWLKRYGYRKTDPFTAELYIGDDHLHVDGINRSARGLCIRTHEHHRDLRVNAAVKMQIPEFGLSAVGKVVWLTEDADTTTVGLQILSFD